MLDAFREECFAATAIVRGTDISGGGAIIAKPLPGRLSADAKLGCYISTGRLGKHRFETLNKLGSPYQILLRNTVMRPLQLPRNAWAKTDHATGRDA